MKYLIVLVCFSILSGCANLKQDKGCERFQLRLDTMNRFCKNMALESAQVQCGDLSDKKVVEECVSIISFKAIDHCYRLVAKSEIEKLYEETCKGF